MISIFNGKDRLKTRQDILRGVYEENLYLLGKGPKVLLRQKNYRLKKMILFMLVCFFTILMSDQYISSSFVTTEPPMSINTDPLSPTQTDISLKSVEDPSEFKSFLNGRDRSLRRMLGLKIKTIMIDAGHGGVDPGCIGKMGTREKDIALDIAKRLKAHLEKNGHYRVLMTREDDTFVSLHERVNLAQKSKADLFISIHLNDLPQKKMNIVETYYFGLSNDEKTLRLAEQENAGSDYRLSDFKEIIEKIGKTMRLQESKGLAESIQAKLFLNIRRHSDDIQNYGVKRAPFIVLLGMEVPSVLVEVCCLSNIEEEQKLHSESYRENIAGYLATGIFDYLNKGVQIHEAKR